MTSSVQSYIVGFVESVCYRPKMYTPTGTFEAAFCFLAGFYDGMASHTRDPRIQALANQNWYGFLEWVQPQVENAANASWQELYRAIQQIAPSESQAFEYLISRYRTYREEYTSRYSPTELFRW